MDGSARLALSRSTSWLPQQLAATFSVPVTSGPRAQHVTSASRVEAIRRSRRYSASSVRAMDRSGQSDLLQFARSCDVDLPVAFSLRSLEGSPRPRPRPSAVLDAPSLRHAGHDDAEHADLYIVCASGARSPTLTPAAQLWADNKPLTIPFRTSFRSNAGGTGRTSVATRATTLTVQMERVDQPADQVSRPAALGAARSDGLRHAWTAGINRADRRGRRDAAAVRAQVHAAQGQAAGTAMARSRGGRQRRVEHAEQGRAGRRRGG